MTSADQASADDQKLVAALDEGKCWEWVSSFLHMNLPGFFRQTVNLYSNFFFANLYAEDLEHPCDYVQ